MAACNFSIPFSGESEAVLSKARAAVQSQGGQLSGDAGAGDFTVSVFGNTIAGSYTVTGQTMNIIIDSKPFLIPCSTIEGFMKNHIGG